MPFQSSVLFADKARSLHKTRLERLDRDKHSSLFGPLIKHEEKRFYKTLGPGPNIIKLFTAVIYKFL
jgi:hypothetical protein